MWLIEISSWKWCTRFLLLKEQVLGQRVWSCCDWPFCYRIILLLSLNGRFLQKISRHLGLICPGNYGWIEIALRLQVRENNWFIDGSWMIIRWSLMISIVTGVIFMSINSIRMLKSLEINGYILFHSTTIPKGGVIKASIV